MRSRMIYLLSFVSSFVILFMLNFTTPSEIGVSGVLLFFTMFFMLVYGFFLGFLGLVGRILGDKKKKISESKKYMYAAVFSFASMIFLITRSFDLRILIFTGIFVFLGCFLVRKRA